MKRRRPKEKSKIKKASFVKKPKKKTVNISGNNLSAPISNNKILPNDSSKNPIQTQTPSITEILKSTYYETPVNLEQSYQDNMKDDLLDNHPYSNQYNLRFFSPNNVIPNNNASIHVSNDENPVCLDQSHQKNINNEHPFDIMDK